MPPDMSALTLEGAAGWAWGSHERKGTMPAFAPKPKKASAKASVAMPGANAWVRNASNSSEPVAEAMAKNEHAIIRKPMWAMMRYRKPPLSDASVRSMMTST